MKKRIARKVVVGGKQEQEKNEEKGEKVDERNEK